MRLYHKDIGLPPAAVAALPRRREVLTYTQHARRAAETDRYGDLSRWLPRLLDFRCVTVVEVGLEDGTLRHVLVRYTMPGTAPALDLVLALKRLPGQWIVKTVWANETNDTHNTLDRSRYAVV